MFVCFSSLLFSGGRPGGQIAALAQTTPPLRSQVITRYLTSTEEQREAGWLQFSPCDSNRLAFHTGEGGSHGSILGRPAGSAYIIPFFLLFLTSPGGCRLFRACTSATAGKTEVSRTVRYLSAFRRCTRGWLVGSCCSEVGSVTGLCKTFFPPWFCVLPAALSVIKHLFVSPPP